MSVDSGCAVSDLRPLGRGPVATVYVGRAADTGAEVAVKMFAERIDKNTRAGFDRERAALEPLRALRCLLPVDDTVEDSGGRWGVRMELCRGSLAGRLESGTALPVREALAVGTAVATALAAAHRVGVVHGAVTPDNVLYRQSGELALADFGLALRQRFPRDPAHAVDYTAPETLRDDTHSAASDLYSLGAVLYTALTGAPPFPRRVGQQRDERILRVLREEAPPLTAAGVPAELSNLIRLLLAKDPQHRPQDPAALAELCTMLRNRLPAQADDHDFDDFRAAAHPVDPPTGPIRLARTEIYKLDSTADSAGKARARDRKQRLALLAGGVAVVVLAAVSLIFLHGSRAEPGQAVTAGPARPAVSQSKATPVVHVVLAPPIDQGTGVQLSWTADSDLDFAVVVAGEHINTMVLMAYRQHSLLVPVDPSRGYCFQIRGTDGQHVYSSQSVPIRGARCGQ
jgi:hypothetical protein